MEKLLYYAAAFFIGMALSLHLAMSSAAGSILKSMPSANLIFWTTGVAATFIVWLVSPGKETLAHIKNVPPYLFFAGVMGAIVITYGIIVLIPKLGAGTAMVIVIAGQIVASLAISQFGILSTPQVSVTLMKIAGALLMVGGAVLVAL